MRHDYHPHDGLGDGPVPGSGPEPLGPATFFADMAATLAGTLEEVVGLEDASGFVARVGSIMGDRIAEGYRAPDGTLPPTPEALADVLVDLKENIGGMFSVDSVTADEIVLVNSRCPFAERVHGRPSLCMMTTNVFGRIVADATGYARIEIVEAIATGAAGCRVIVHLTRDGTRDGHEFFV